MALALMVPRKHGCKTPRALIQLDRLEDTWTPCKPTLDLGRT